MTQYLERGDDQKPLRIPEDCHYWEKDNPNFIENPQLRTASQSSSYFEIVGAEIIPFRRGTGATTETRLSRYFFNDKGYATAFMRRHQRPDAISRRKLVASDQRVRFETIYPDSEINAYFRWSITTQNDPIDNVLEDTTNDSPQIWFGRLFVDHGSSRQQDEMAQNLGSLEYRSGKIKSIDLGANFVNFFDLSKGIDLLYPCPGRPYLIGRGAAEVEEDFVLRFLDDPNGSKMEATSNTSAVILDPQGDPSFTVSWGIKNGVLSLEQVHKATGIRKSVLAKLRINQILAFEYGTKTPNVMVDPATATDGWLEMARIIGCNMRISGIRYIAQLFED